MSKIGGVEKAGKAAESMNLGARAGTGEDLAKGLQRILKGKRENSELMLKTLDNVVDTKYVSQMYKKLFEEGGVSKSEGGVRINKANGLVDEASNAAGKVERGPGVIERGSTTNKFFKNQSLLDEHYGKHGQEIADVLGDSNYSIDKYLDDANYIINNGTYTPELNGYVSFMSGKKYGFVGLDRTTGDITTFHIKNISELIKKAPSLGFER